MVLLFLNLLCLIVGLIKIGGKKLLPFLFFKLKRFNLVKFNYVFKFN